MIERLAMQTSTDYEAFWRRVNSVFETHAPGLLRAMNPPATAEQLEAVEGEIGYQLHADIREAYLRHDGMIYPENGAYQFPLFDTMAVWMPLKVALEAWRALRSSYAEIRVTAPDMFPKPADWWADLHVRPVSWDEGHFPIGDTSTTYQIFVDMVPAGKGQVGQIFGDDGSAEDQPLLAPSFNVLLNAIAGHLESGAVLFDPSKGGLYSASNGHGITCYYPEIRTRNR
jgi:cell wall assembly regulator SMI1